MRDVFFYESIPQDQKCTILRSMRTDVRKLEKLYGESGTSKATAEKFSKSITRKRAEMVVASLVNECAWDGRISPTVREWAKHVESAWDARAMGAMRVSTTLHPTHLDSVAYEFARKEW